MRNIIEELYYGNISPNDRDIVKGGTYSHLLHLLTRNEDELMKTLSDTQRETFEKFRDCASELNDANEVAYKILCPKCHQVMTCVGGPRNLHELGAYACKCDNY